MKKLLVLLLLASILVDGCTTRSALKTETGYVVEKQYFPDTQQTVTGTGFSSNGNMVVTTHYVGDAEKYIVIFKCEHSMVFSINRSELYGSLNKGDTVSITYFEVLNSDNEVVYFDFVNAVK